MVKKTRKSLLYWFVKIGIVLYLENVIVLLNSFHQVLSYKTEFYFTSFMFT